MKEFDTFSFQGKKSLKEIQGENKAQFQDRPIRWNSIQYRFKRIETNKPKLVNDRIMNIEKDLQQNIRRRMELQQKLNGLSQGNKQTIFNQYLKQQNVQTETQQIQKYIKMEHKAQKVAAMMEKPQISFQNRRKKMQVQKQQKKAPSQIKINQLFKKVTFPELPKLNLQILTKECQYLYKQYQHSDLNYLLMCIYFHLGKYSKVREHYKQIITYKLFQTKAHWVAAQTQFQCSNFELCVKLADKCMKQLADQNLPRFIYLQARSYDSMGNYINSVVCYNQLIKIKPKIAQYYLERGIIYAKIGYLKEAHEDFLMFGMLKPQASEYLKQKILIEKDQIRKKQYLRVLRNLN